MLVSSWARLGSGNRPFLLLRIWRIKKNNTARFRRKSTECVFRSGQQAPGDYMNYYTEFTSSGFVCAATGDAGERRDRVTGFSIHFEIILLSDVQLNVGPDTICSFACTF